MERTTYSEALTRLEGFDDWLRSLGLTPRSNDRIHLSFRRLREADEASLRGRRTGDYEDVRTEDYFPITEALEAVDVFTAFQGDASPGLAATLKRALSGPGQPSDETSRNTDGRNLWFELALAAEWKLRGASVVLGEPDLQLEREGFTFLIACKRPFDPKTVGANIGSAVKQLRLRLAEAPEGVYGVVAISLSRALNKGIKLLVGDKGQIGTMLDGEIRKEEAHLMRIDHPRICAAIFHLATPSQGHDGLDMVRVSHTRGKILTDSVGMATFARHAAEVSAASKHP